METHVTLQLNDCVEKLKSTKFTSERQRTQVLGITSLNVGFLLGMLHGVRKHRLDHRTTNKTEQNMTLGNCTHIAKLSTILFERLTLK